MNKLIYKGNLHDFNKFADVGITRGNWNERVIKYFQYLGATSSSFNTAQKQTANSVLETLRLDFVNQDYAVGSAGTGAVETKDTFDNILTFSRGSTGTYFDSAGVLQTAAVDEPRFTYNPDTLEAEGLLLEGQRTNLLLQSEAFGTASWAKQFTTISSDLTSAPDGLTTADKVVESVDDGEHYAQQSGLPLTSGDFVSFFFVKAAERTKGSIIPVHLSEESSLTRINFDLVAGTIDAPGAGLSTDTGIVGLLNGWFLVYVAYTLTGAATSHRTRLTLRNDEGGHLYVGDDSSGMYVWGAQTEQASFRSSYIKTESSQVTRSADSCSRTLGDEYNSSEGRVEAVAKNHIGEFIFNLGTQSTLADVDAEKTYTLTYSSNPSASTLDILSSGSGTVKSVKYYPREQA